MSIKNKILSKIPSTTVTNLTNNFTQIKKFQSSDVAANDRFGWSVAVSITRIVVGAPYEDTTATGAGSAYIFDMNGNELAKIQASDAAGYDEFGNSVACSDTRIVVGAQYEDTTANGAGSAYIFDIDGNELAKIQASDAAVYDQFGKSVACSDTRIVVGVPYEDTTASDAGSSYIFDIDGNELAKIQASDAGSGDRFGNAVAVSNSRIVVGAPYEDTAASNAGAVYVFKNFYNNITSINFRKLRHLFTGTI